MKKYSYVGISFVILIFGIIFFPKVMDRIENQSISESTRLAKSENLSFIKLNSEKRKVPEFLFLNQDSLLISNEDFIGKVFVVEFFFTRCPSICIEMNKNMKILDEIYGDRKDFGIASFTIDPDNDTPTTLKKYSELLEVKSKNWHFLTGDKKDIYELSNTGFNIFSSINEAVDGGFEHQGFFALIDQDGYIRSRVNDYNVPLVYYSGINNENSEIQGIDMIKEDINKLLKIN
ncbi:MAG: SCO family protein [Bacteroidetes bacterium]|jgi:protein SCO1|nr:MAG: photosynthetic protein synthase II [Cryomorphaceae bacterium BACL29 MAG-121220-bin8]MDA0757691.1 SCO family protein [Bacteroidota bacterium]MDA1018835.1 SCO family protein [Bacteroidota bacterium]|tara:strand:+ start:1138 stop:1836 length:699 start_codon:yes stop_codon:yes gene_type:complete